MPRFVLAASLAAALVVLPAVGGAVENGTRVIVSELSYWTLIARLEAAIKKHKLRVVTRASVRGAAKQRKLGIPGNMVIGAFGDKYAARIMQANVAAGIEAPIRFYITRNEDAKTTTLWFRRPSWVLAQYDSDGALRKVAGELDTVMEKIVQEAVARKTLLVKRKPKKRKSEVGTARKNQVKQTSTRRAARKRGNAAALPKRPAKSPVSKQAAARPAPKKVDTKTISAKAATAGRIGNGDRGAATPRLRPKPLRRAAPAQPPAAKESNGERPKTGRREVRRTDTKPQQRANSAASGKRSIEISPLLLRLQGR